jgi:glycosyltransferase involved in cell wall biosynthesis
VNVVALASTWRIGGAERVTLSSARGLAKRGHRVRLASLREPGPVGDLARKEGLFGASHLAPGRPGLRGLLRVRSLLRREGADVLYLLDHENAAVLGVLAALAAGVRRRFLAIHTMGMWGGKSSLPAGIRTMLPLLTRIVAVAEAQREYLVRRERVARGRIEVVPNGIELSDGAPVPREAARRALGVPAGARVVAVVAQLRPEKGHEVYLEAARRLLERTRDAVTLFAGDGPMRQELEARAEGLGLGDRVRFLGARDDVPVVLAASDVCALPSHPVVETSPLAAMEAMAAGRPVVATKVGALAEIVEHGLSGFLVPPGDPEALAGALAHLLNDDVLRARLGENARRRARERFGIERTLDLTERLLAGRPVTEGATGGAG